MGLGVKILGMLLIIWGYGIAGIKWYKSWDMECLVSLRFDDVWIYILYYGVDIF